MGHRTLVSERFKSDAVLNRVLNTTRTERFYLHPYLRLKAVRKIKNALIDAGFSLPRNAKRTRGPTSTFDSETKRAVIQFQRFHGLKGTDVDGWVGPKTLALMDKNIGNVPPKFARLVKKTVSEFAAKLLAAKKLGLVIMPYPGRNGQWMYQARQGAWRYVPQSRNWQPADPNKPAEAIDKLLKEYDEWFFDCGLFTSAVGLVAFRRAWKEGVKRYGWAAFNQKFRNLVQLEQTDVSKPMKADTITRSGTGSDPAFDKVWENAPVGSKVMWRNRITYVVESSSWKNEWGVKHKHSAKPARSRYAAHPLGYNLTEGRVKLKLAERDTNASRRNLSTNWRFVIANPRRLQGITAMKLPYDMIPLSMKRRWIEKNILRWKVVRRRFPAPR